VPARAGSIRNVRLAGSLSGLKAGDTVSVEGDDAGPDTVATTITQRRR
jgi:hypothetical protein